MKQRTNGFQIMYSEQQQKWKDSRCCPICGLPKEEWKRRTDWACCSKKCSDEHNKVNIKIWPSIRSKIIKRDNYTCKHCGWHPEIKGEAYWAHDAAFVVDHIVPIAMNGLEWDESNMQTLCIKCNKIKTKQDMADIAKYRLKERFINAGQNFLEDKDEKRN